MEIERIEKGLKNTKLFEKFITQRFPEEESEEYIGEWAKRFLRGRPMDYMNKKSKDIYIEILQEELIEKVTPKRFIKLTKRVKL